MSAVGVLLDLNNPEFQRQLFELDKTDQRRVLVTLRKLSGMAWEQVYRGLTRDGVSNGSGISGVE